MNVSRTAQLWIFGGLALLMSISRCQPLEHFLELPDASWAVFFIGGFYLRPIIRWALPLLMVEPLVIDWFAVQHMGVSDFCVTQAYWFLIPTHAAMWFGGQWLRSRATQDLRGLGALALSAFIATTVAYAISNGSFYWLGHREPNPNFAPYIERFAQYYQWFLLVPCAYIACTAVVHLGIARALHAPVSSRSRR